MIEKDSALGLLGAILAAAGLLLVFCGYLFTKAESYETVRGDKFKILAKIGAVPLAVSFACSWSCILVLQGNPWAQAHTLLLFKIALVITAIYSIVSLLSL